MEYNVAKKQIIIEKTDPLFSFIKDYCKKSKKNELYIAKNGCIIFSGENLAKNLMGLLTDLSKQEQQIKGQLALRFIAELLLAQMAINGADQNLITIRRARIEALVRAITVIQIKQSGISPCFEVQTTLEKTFESITKSLEICAASLESSDGSSNNFTVGKGNSNSSKSKYAKYSQPKAISSKLTKIKEKQNSVSMSVASAYQILYDEDKSEKAERSYEKFIEITKEDSKLTKSLAESLNSSRKQSSISHSNNHVDFYKALAKASPKNIKIDEKDEPAIDQRMSEWLKRKTTAGRSIAQLLVDTELRSHELGFWSFLHSPRETYRNYQAKTVVDEMLNIQEQSRKAKNGKDVINWKKTLFKYMEYARNITKESSAVSGTKANFLRKEIEKYQRQLESKFESFKPDKKQIDDVNRTILRLMVLAVQIEPLLREQNVSEKQSLVITAK